MKTDKQQNIEATCMALTLLIELASKDCHAMLAYLIEIALIEAREAHAKVKLT